jgi:hypothetical protein
MALTDNVVALLFFGAGLILMFKYFEKPGLQDKKPLPKMFYQTGDSSNIPFSNPKWGNFFGSADDSRWIR